LSILNKSTKIASIIVASVLVTVGTTLTLVLQQEQKVNAASPRNPIANGILQSVRVDHRNQHSNQENLCYRSNTCRDSNVEQGTLGNDNQVTGFGDQSDNTNNNTSTANGGAQGSPGAAGVAGAQGPAGPAGPEKITSTREVVGDNSTGGSGPLGSIARCADDEAVTGGGYSATPPPGGGSFLVTNNHRINGGGNGWSVVISVNSPSGLASLTAFAECAKLVPPP
jgi:hypothetical protein